MTRSITRRHVLSGGAVAALTALAGCSGLTPFVGRREEETLTLDPADTVEVVTVSGDVTVRSEPRENVRVEVLKESSSVGTDLDKIGVRTDRSANQLTIRGEFPDDGGLAGRPTVDLDVTLPSESGLVHAEAAAGNIDVRGVSTVDSDGVDLQARSGAGDVTVRDVAGTVAADTAAGGVTVRGVDAVGDISTSAGNVNVDIPAINGDVEIESSTGDVAVAVAPDLDTRFRASVSTGSVTIDGVDLDDATRDDDSVTGVIGDGGPTLRIETSTGDVTVSTLS